MLLISIRLKQELYPGIVEGWGAILRSSVPQEPYPGTARRIFVFSDFVLACFQLRLGFVLSFFGFATYFTDFCHEPNP